MNKIVISSLLVSLFTIMACSQQELPIIQNNISQQETKISSNGSDSVSISSGDLIDVKKLSNGYKVEMYIEGMMGENMGKNLLTTIMISKSPFKIVVQQGTGLNEYFAKIGFDSIIDALETSSKPRSLEFDNSALKECINFLKSKNKK